MLSQFTADGIFHSLCDRIETETIGQVLASLKGIRIQIDAPFHIALGGFLRQPHLVADGSTVAVEGSHDIDFLVGRCAERRNKLQQDAVCARLKLLTLMVEHDIIFVRTAAHQTHQGQHSQHQTIYFLVHDLISF